jgi:leader peptidase (prepilin peptidase) / N-methyltransferase
MIVLAALIGPGIGWMLTWASDYLPRFAYEQPESLPAGSFSLAVWQVMRGGHDRPWLRLHAGVELASALFLGYLWAQSPTLETGVVSLAAFMFFVLIAVIDIKYRLVLNILVYPAIIVVLVVRIVVIGHAPLPVVLGGLFAFVIFYGTARIKAGGLGAGDVKLAALIGFTFGFPQILWPLLLGAGAAGVLIAYLLITRRGGLATTFPYAPFLCFGVLAALLYTPLALQAGRLL